MRNTGVATIKEKRHELKVVAGRGVFVESFVGSLFAPFTGSYEYGGGQTGGAPATTQPTTRRGVLPLREAGTLGRRLLRAHGRGWEKVVGLVAARLEKSIHFEGRVLGAARVGLTCTL